jgi:hypothetical protein
MRTVAGNDTHGRLLKRQICPADFGQLLHTNNKSNMGLSFIFGAKGDLSKYGRFALLFFKSPPETTVGQILARFYIQTTNQIWWDLASTSYIWGEGNPNMGLSFKKLFFICGGLRFFF